MGSRMHISLQGARDSGPWATGAAIPVDDRDMMTPTSKISERIRLADAWLKILLDVYAGFDLLYGWAFCVRSKRRKNMSDLIV